MTFFIGVWYKYVSYSILSSKHRPNRASITTSKHPTNSPLLVRQKMEPVGAISEGEWGSLSGMYTTEEAEFMAQLLGNCSSFPNELDGGSSLGIPSAFWAAGHESVNKSLYCSSDAANTNLYCFSQGSSYSGGSSSLFPNSSQGNYYLSDFQQVLGGNNSAMSMDFCIGDDKNNSLAVQVFADSLMEGDEYCLNVEECRRNFPEMPELPSATEDKNNKMPENSKKRMRDSGDVSIKKKFFISSYGGAYIFCRSLIVVLQCRSKRTRGM